MSLLATFHAVDLHVLYLINQTWSRPWLDPVMARVSDFGNTAKCLLALAVTVTLIFGGFRGRLLVVLMATCLLVGDAGIDRVFKLLFNRPRPNETEPHIRVLSIREVKESTPHPVAVGRSFPSGHAFNNVALAMVGCAIFGWRGAWLWAWAALVSYSRIYVGAHYPSDILGSCLVSLIYSFFIIKAAEWLWQLHAPGRWPKLYAAHPVLFPSWAPVLKVARPAPVAG
ncbi:MAG TPA: phosphatase PAP2 family protein [Candidatus Methylacidiphilales bacterium]|jgi:undecaprenyl-diphosphatase|nr:phosphatase PAP2 family protein [Candidatus Methylacidiphilales bacterium]